MIRRLLVVLFLISIVVSALIAEPGGVSLTIPDDYGIDVPENVLMFGKFVIELNPESEARQLLRSSDVSVVDSDDISLRLRYFGNSSSVYAVDFYADAFIGAEEGFFPVMDSVVITGAVKDGSVVVKERTGSGADIRIEPGGLKRGISVADVSLDLDIPQDILPENYKIGLLLSLSAK